MLFYIKNPQNCLGKERSCSSSDGRLVLQQMQTGRSRALARGQVFELEGKTFFTMGGAPTFHKARLMGLIDGPDPGVPTDKGQLHGPRRNAADESRSELGAAP